MMLIATKENLQKASRHLNADPALEPLIERWGLPKFVPHTDYYRALGDSIIGQQLSVKAAASIKQKFRALFGGVFPAPEAILEKSIDELRTAGLSRAKAVYIQDLAHHILDGRVRFNRIPEQSNAEIIAELTDIKGIGEWTVHMFLMFCVGRLDVLAYGDLGVRNAIKNLYHFDHLPTKDEIEVLAEINDWHPYESVACWYLWRSLENTPA